MSISLEETVLAVRRVFRDMKWTNETLREWIKDAVRVYSGHFPLVAETSGSATTGVLAYDLDVHCLGVLEVEYPEGESPLKFPARHSHFEASFLGDGLSYYDVDIYPGSDTNVLWLSQPETGSDYRVKYLTEHTWTASGPDYTADIPDAHRPIIVRYAAWQCWVELATTEIEVVDSQKMAYIQEQQRRARRDYQQALEAAKGAKALESEILTWEIDHYDRIY